MSEENKASIRRVYEAINAGNLDTLAEVIADDVVEHDVVPGMEPTKAGVIQFFTDLLKSFPDLKITVDDIFAEGEKVTARTIMTGTNKGEFMCMPATGKEVSVPIGDYFRFENGKVAEHWARLWSITGLSGAGRSGCARGAGWGGAVLVDGRTSQTYLYREQTKRSTLMTRIIDLKKLNEKAVDASVASLTGSDENGRVAESLKPGKKDGTKGR